MTAMTFVRFKTVRRRRDASLPRRGQASHDAPTQSLCLPTGVQKRSQKSRGRFGSSLLKLLRRPITSALSRGEQKRGRRRRQLGGVDEDAVPGFDEDELVQAGEIEGEKVSPIHPAQKPSQVRVAEI